MTPKIAFTVRGGPFRVMVFDEFSVDYLLALIMFP